MKGCNYKRWNVKHIKEVHSLVVIAVNNCLKLIGFVLYQLYNQSINKI